MTNNLACLRRARGRARGLAPSVSHLRRWSVAIGLAAAVFVTASGVPTPARADDPPDPAARLQVFLKSVYIRDDEDWIGSGELTLSAEVCVEEVYVDPLEVCRDRQRAFMLHSFSASSGDAVTLERVVPRDGDTMASDVSAEGGIPVYPGQHYGFVADMSDGDSASYDEMGSLVVPVDEEHNWGIGTYTIRSRHLTGENGDYDLSFEIRKAPLPDLNVHGFGVVEASDGRFYCGQVENVGERPSPPIPLTIRANELLVQSTTLSALEPGQTTEHCVLRSVLPDKAHILWFALDEPRQIPEMDESNNLSGLAIRSLEPAASGPVAVSSPQPTAPASSGKPPASSPTPGDPDLTISAIKVNGQVPDGKDDCTVGKNTVIVVIKNAGRAESNTFGVRLAVDSTNLDASVLGLSAGQEREIVFNDVQLKKGEHALKAIANPQHAVTESQDNNNELKITARCQTAG